MLQFLLKVALVTLIFSEAALANRSKPNIILIFTDDMGYGDLSCYGSPNIKTRYLDQMAEEGMRFTSFYVAPVCGPSRAQLMTGCYHARTQNSHNELPGSKTGLNLNEVTIAEVLKNAGYKTAMVGKWHLGDASEFLPTRQGFDSFWGFPYSHDMWPYHPASSAQTIKNAEDKELMEYILKRKKELKYTVKGSWNFPDLPLLDNETVIEKNPEQSQMTTRFTEKALNFIEKNAEQPFFLYFAHTMPHTPLFVSEKFSGKSERGLYGGAMMEVDWSCGQIIKKLKELGIDKDTLIVFTSDNGPAGGYGADCGSAGVLKGIKGSVNEGGVRVPAIFRWPNVIPAGVETDAIASSIDLLPTFAHLAQGTVPSDRVIDGQNITEVLTNKSKTSPHQYLHYFSMSGAKSNKVNYKGLRNQKWKLLVKTSRSGELVPVQLYDLESDISEKNNVLKQNSEIAKTMAVDASKFLEEFKANRRPVGTLKNK